MAFDWTFGNDDPDPCMVKHVKYDPGIFESKGYGSSIESKGCDEEFYQNIDHELESIRRSMKTGHVSIAMFWICFLNDNMMIYFIRLLIETAPLEIASWLTNYHLYGMEKFESLVEKIKKVGFDKINKKLRIDERMVSNHQLLNIVGQINFGAYV